MARRSGPQGARGPRFVEPPEPPVSTPLRRGVALNSEYTCIAWQRGRRALAAQIRDDYATHRGLWVHEGTTATPEDEQCGCDRLSEHEDSATTSRRGCLPGDYCLKTAPKTRNSHRLSANQRRFLKGTTLKWQNQKLSLMIYHLPEQLSLKTRSSCMHYIIMSNLLLQFTQFIHYPLLQLVFYRFIVLYIRACILCLF